MVEYRAVPIAVAVADDMVRVRAVGGVDTLEGAAAFFIGVEMLGDDPDPVAP